MHLIVSVVQISNHLDGHLTLISIANMNEKNLFFEKNKHTGDETVLKIRDTTNFNTNTGISWSILIYHSGHDKWFLVE